MTGCFSALGAGFYALFQPLKRFALEAVFCQSISDALIVTSTDGSASQPNVAAPTGVNDKRDATDHGGAAFFTGSVPANSSEPNAFDSASMPALGAGAPLGRVSDNDVGAFFLESTLCLGVCHIEPS